MLSKNQIDGVFNQTDEMLKDKESILNYFKLSLLEQINQYNFTVSYNFIEAIIDSVIDTEKTVDINISKLKTLRFHCLLALFYVNSLSNHKLNNVLFSLQIMRGPIGVCHYVNKQNEIERCTVECATQICSTKYSTEAIQDIQLFHKINIEEILTFLSDQLVSEVVERLVNQLETIKADSITKGLSQSYDECGIDMEDYVEFNGKYYPNCNQTYDTSLRAPFIVLPYTVTTNMVVVADTFQPLMGVTMRQGVVHVNKQYKNIVVTNSK